MVAALCFTLSSSSCRQAARSWRLPSRVRSSPIRRPRLCWRLMSSTRANSSSQSRSGTVWSSEVVLPSLAVETTSERSSELDCSGVKELDKLLRESEVYRSAGVVVQEWLVELVSEEEKLPKNGLLISLAVQ